MNRFRTFRIESLEDRRLFAGLDGAPTEAPDAPVDNSQPAEVGQPNTPTEVTPQKPVVSLPQEVHITSEELAKALQDLDKEPQPPERPAGVDPRTTVEDVLWVDIGGRVYFETFEEDFEYTGPGEWMLGPDPDRHICDDLDCGICEENAIDDREAQDWADSFYEEELRKAKEREVDPNGYMDLFKGEFDPDCIL